MDLWTIILIALALAVDAFAVALASGVSLCQVSGRQTFRLAFHFGLFQAMMNIVGWAAGLTVRTTLESIDHWLAFGLLALVAAKMIKDAITGREEEAQKVDPTKGYTLIMLSVATSIDSLAVGLSFSMLNVSMDACSYNRFSRNPADSHWLKARLFTGGRFKDWIQGRNRRRACAAGYRI